jgi:CysZ protein
VFVARHRLWAYLIAPVLLDLALGIGAIYGTQRWLRHESWLASLMTDQPVFGWLALIGLTSVLAALIFLVAQPLILAVSSDRLSERVEKDARGSAPSAPFLTSAGRAIAHGFLKLVLYGLAVFIGAIVSGFLSPLVGTAIGLGIGVLFLAYDGFDYPLSRRNATFAKKWAYLAVHPAQTLGFGLGATLLYLIPFALFVAPPFVAAGATLAFLDGEPTKKAVNGDGNLAATG